MSNTLKAIIAVGIVGILAAAAVISRNRDDSIGTLVRVATVEARDLFQFVEASGNIRAVRTVDISSDVSAKVTEVLVEEGDYVKSGQVLLRLEPDRYQAALDRTEAALAQSNAGLQQQQASLASATRALERMEGLDARGGNGLVSDQQLEDARTQLQIAEANVSSARHGVEQAEAAVSEAGEELSKTVFTAPMDGRVTRLNVEEGETVIIGTMNNPGSLVLTISDLSVMEVVVKVDETNVPDISIGDDAVVAIDAFPEMEFLGTVTEIGNSAIVPPSQQNTGTQAAIDFEVVITLAPTGVELRPDLSATAEIVTERRVGTLSVPFIALTAREGDGGMIRRDDGNEEETSVGLNRSLSSTEEEAEPVEGVFTIEGGIVTFTPVEVGITGRDYFEVVAGVSQGDSVVAGPYQAVRILDTGDRIRVSDRPVVN